MRRIHPEKGRLLRRLLQIGAIVAIAGGLGWWLDMRWRVAHWQVEADRPELAAAIENWLAAHRAELGLWKARPARIREQLRKALPEIASIEVIRRLPDRLIVRATARKAVALVAVASNWMLIDAEGALWPAKGTEDLPLLRADASRHRQGAEILQVLQAWGWWDAASEVRFDGLGWRVLFVGGERWLLPAQGAPARASEVARMLMRPKWRAYRWRVDARSKKRWFLRPVGRKEVG